MLALPQTRGARARQTLAALSASLALIEFSPEGIILTANKNFCRAMGYTLDELKGRHHRLFMPPGEAETAAYRAFWQKLARGESDAGVIHRVAKGGCAIWLQASYNPVKNAAGRTVRIIKQATDITAEKRRAAEVDGIMAAISRAQAVIEFTPAGEIITANQNFLDTMGYRLEEIAGQHHRMFVDPAEAASPAYARFWENLRAGQLFQGEFKRFAKSGAPVWLQATYAPIFLPSGEISKMIKLAVNITGRVTAVSTLTTALRQLAKRDITFRADQAFTAEFEPVRQDLNASFANLQDSIHAIAASAAAVRVTAGEISRAADDMARRTEHQAAALEQTASTLTEVTTTINATAANTARARDTAGTAKSDAEHSAGVIRDTVAAMAGIETSSHQIRAIIGVIDEIAFQTNLLALNAGVEAARAGDAGRGFAVVATEVRALAQRSADSARQIKDLIGNASAQVETGVKLVAQTGDALTRITSKVDELDGLIRTIATAAGEQSIAVAQVGQALSAMGDVTQKNAAMVGETTAASHDLAHDADNLAELIAQFQTSPHQRPPTGPAAQDSTVKPTFMVT